MSTRLRAVVVADSITLYGDRITTLELTFPRFLLPEFNTHRDFSRNSASSRARSVKKTLAEVSGDPFIPWHWTTEHVGMSGGEPLTGDDLLNARVAWRDACYSSLRYAETLVGLGVPAAFVYMAHDCIRRRSTQSATGILYVAGVLVFLGEMVALYLVRETGLPF